MYHTTERIDRALHGPSDSVSEERMQNCMGGQESPRHDMLLVTCLVSRYRSGRGGGCYAACCIGCMLVKARTSNQLTQAIFGVSMY